MTIPCSRAWYCHMDILVDSEDNGDVDLRHYLQARSDDGTLPERVWSGLYPTSMA
jgi:hypothetical protein